MRLRLVIPALVLAALACAPAAQAQRGQPRIIAGSDVSISTYPFQVRVQVTIGQNTFLCGGAIRDSTHVITAGHCVTTGAVIHAPVPAQNVKVFYGSDVRAQQSMVGVSAVSVPSDYTKAPVSDDAYDVALLELSTPISGPTAKPIPLAAPRASQPKDAGTAIVTGWGTTSEGGSSSQTLKGTRIPLRPGSECASRYGTTGALPNYLYYDDLRAVCAGGGTLPNGQNPDTCQGDSGGPLVVDLDPSDATDFVLMGITSFGDGCGRQGTPAVYTYTQGDGIAAFLSASTYQSPTAPTSGDFSSGTPGVLTRGPSPAPVVPIPSVQVPAPPQPTPVIATRDTTRPTAKLSKLSCTRKRKCSFRVAAADRGGTVRKLSATVSRRVRTCRTRGDFRVCKTTTRKKTLKPKRVSGGFTFSGTLAKATYKLTAVATDAAGNRSTTVSRTFRVR